MCSPADESESDAQRKREVGEPSSRTSGIDISPLRKGALTSLDLIIIWSDIDVAWSSFGVSKWYSVSKL